MSFERPKILVIEDNPADTHVLRLALVKEMGEIEFEVLADGQAALQFVRDNRGGLVQPSPCVIIVDLHLPKHNGLAVLEAIRSSPALGHLSVIVLSSVVTPFEQAKVEEMGAAFQQKPGTLSGFEELAVFISGVCKGSATTTAA